MQMTKEICSFVLYCHYQSLLTQHKLLHHTFRLVGALERTTSHFQCFTIRQAQPVELRFAPKLVTMCDNALTNIVSMIAEA